MEIESDKKVDILISALEERYSSVHRIRDRVQSIGIWAIGLLLGAGGWILQSGITYTSGQKFLVLLGVVAAFVVLRFVYLADLQKGFRTQQSVVVRLEKALGLFTPDVFDKTSEPIYPKKWEHAGSHEGSGKFFVATYTLLYVGVAFLILVILFSGAFVQQPHFIITTLFNGQYSLGNL
jgi:hypothetical protein